MTIEWIKKINILKFFLFGILVSPILAVCPMIFDSYDFAKMVCLVCFCLVYALVGFWALKKQGADAALNFADIFPLAVVSFSGLSIFWSADKILSFLGGFGTASQWDLGIIGKFSQGFLAYVIFLAVYFIFSRINIQEFSVKKIFDWLLVAQAFCLAIFYCGLFGIIGHGYFPLLPGILKEIPSFINTANPLGWGIVPFSVFCSIMSAVCFYAIGKFFPDQKSGYLAIAVLFLQLPIIYLAKFWPNNLLIAASSAVALLIFGWRNNRLAKVIFLAAFIFSIIVLLPQASGFIYRNFSANIIGEPVLPIGQSFQIALNSLSSGTKNFLLGTGVGTYGINYLLHRGDAISKEPFWQVRFQESGSYLAELASTIGIIGLGLFVAFICYFCYLAFIKSRDNKEVLGLGLVFLLVSASLIFYHSSAWQLVLLFALAGLISRVTPSREIVKFKAASWLGFGLFGLTVIVFVISSYFLGNFVLADSAYLSALHSSTEKEVAGNIKFAVEHNKYSELYLFSLAKTNYLELYNLAKDPKTSQDKQLISDAVVKVDNVITRSVSYFPRRFSVWESKGSFFRELAPFEPKALVAAIAALEEAKKLNPNDSALLTDIGTLYLAVGETDKADENVSKAVMLKPDYMPAIKERSLILERRGKIEDAIILLEGALKTYQEPNIDLVFQLGRLYYRVNRLSDAKSVFESIIVLSPNHSDSLFLLGEILKKEGKISEANKYFQKVLDLNPGNAEVLKAMRGDFAANQATTTKSK